MSKKVEQIVYTVVSLIVVAMYIAGMILMILRLTGNGITLWVVSTVIGALLLYVRRTRAKIKADAEAEEAEELKKQGMNGKGDA